MLARRRSLVSVTIDLYGGSRATISLSPANGRWPTSYGSDRLTIPACISALALAEATGAAASRLTATLRRAAAALVIGDLISEHDRIERVCGVRLEAHDGVVGWPRILIGLGSTRDGPVATVHGSSPSGLALGTAATVATAALLAGAERDLRLSGALALEGLLIYHREVENPTGRGARAAAFSLRYAAARLREADRPVPDDLQRANRRVVTRRAGAVPTPG